MSTAVEHLGKSYLCAIHPVLLHSDRPDFRHMLALVGLEARGRVSLDQVFTAGADAVLKRCDALRPVLQSHSVKELLHARNGIVHLASDNGSQVRALLSCGVTYLNGLIYDLNAELVDQGKTSFVDAASFWRDDLAFSQSLVREATTDVQLELVRLTGRQVEVAIQVGDTLGPR